MTHADASIDIGDGVAPAAPAEFSIGDLAEIFSVTPRAIRFYEDQGLLSPRRLGNMRIYTYRDRARLHLILRGKRLGFSLAEIKELLDLYDVKDEQVSQARKTLGRIRWRVQKLEEQSATILTMIDELGDIEQQCAEFLQDRDVDPNQIAPIPSGESDPIA